MRLSEVEKKTIKAVFRKLDPAARIFVFGSRTNDNLKGGDIDLLVLSDKLGFSDKITALTEMKLQLGEQKIDLLIKNSRESHEDPFVVSILRYACEV